MKKSKKQTTTGKQNNILRLLPRPPYLQDPWKLLFFVFSMFFVFCFSQWGPLQRVPRYVFVFFRCIFWFSGFARESLHPDLQCTTLPLRVFKRETQGMLTMYY